MSAPCRQDVLTQALLQHVDQCMRHEDVVKKSMLAQLARTLTEWHCNSFTDLIDEMELWDWNVANKDFWSRLAKSLHSQKVSVSCFVFIHMGRKNGQKTRFGARPWKDELGNGNAVHQEVPNTN